MASQTGKIALTTADVLHRTLVAGLFGMSVYGSVAIFVQVKKSRDMVDIARKDALLKGTNSEGLTGEIDIKEMEKPMEPLVAPSPPKQWFTRD